ncbi:holliday junction resolvase RusA-like protein [Rhizobium phage RHph_X2_28B]|uniref:RusA-like Holliday junction resolvase n=1 Tax=Rhizobium phage RHph_X2_28B TaxID=2836086 RepID=UPI002329133A|nr:RusA-like Holliday junction resolvase [Rhizobium phage RHph_X2_28B]QWY83516.1 holliday junction resolvase RusA-like protein [Rhizobium phage RHph_X2_28B]
MVLSKKKQDKFYLNLNVYRNAHFRKLNDAKVKFKELVKDAIDTLPSMKQVELIFTLFMGSQRSADLSNICSVVDKFFCDALVELGKLPDDDYDVISAVDYRFGGVDKNNPRVDVTLKPLVNAEEENMQITIVQSEIEAAITAYIKSQITVNENMDVNIELRATRGAEGFQAVIDIVPSQVKKVTRRASSNEGATSNGSSTLGIQRGEEREEVQEEAQTGKLPEPDSEQAEAEAEAPFNPGVSKSLFGGLKTPENA